MQMATPFPDGYTEILFATSRLVYKQENTYKTLYVEHNLFYKVKTFKALTLQVFRSHLI